MKLIEEREKLMSNFEVYQHICDVQRENMWAFTIAATEKPKKSRFNPQLLDLEIITRDLGHYLTKADQGNHVKTENFVGLMIYLNSLELEVIEKLMIMNLLPRSLVNLYAIIEECEERFATEVCEDILLNVARYFPVSLDENMEVNEEDETNVAQTTTNTIPEEDEEDEDAFFDENQLEHESFVNKKDTEKEIDEVDA
ncbi:hypothetical protein CANINC_003862 [Pichia inconspicua]|uniref:DNA-directed RNA polymerase III subunit RPC9 n=1 Tax=Pichia inconspicua TaxID=52247 RepID=A0A4T0WXM5_9ASCO|nr:hypothetical protein CANINC_003862 [[Candida] inconspicua]